MTAQEELNRIASKIKDGSMSPNEPLFVLRAQDRTAALFVRKWLILAQAIGTPHGKINEAGTLAAQMDSWPVKQIPGRPDTRTTRNSEELT